MKGAIKITTCLGWLMLACASFAKSASAQVLPSGGVDISVASQVNPHVASLPVRPMPPLAENHSIVAKGNFGRAITFELMIDRVRLENGLYEIRAFGGEAGDKTGSPGGGALSLCGLLILSSAGKSHNVSTNYTQVGGFLVVFHTSSDSEISTGIVALESSVPSLCNLSPGTDFTYRVDGRATLDLKGTFSRARKYDFSGSARNDCVASTSTKSASTIAPSLMGEYVELSCVQTPVKKGRSVSSTVAYLLDYHYYLPLETRGNGAHTKITYSVAELAAP